MNTALLISVQGIGNTVLMTPVMRKLEGMGYEVDAIVSDNGSHEVLKLSSGVRKQYLWREREGAVRNLWRLRSELQERRYTTAYALYPNGKRENALLCLARANKKARYTDPQNYYRLLEFLPATHKVPLKKAHDVANNLQLIQMNGDSTVALPEPILSEASRAFADKFLSTNQLAGKFVVAVHPGGGGLAKRWNETNYRELCRRLLEDESIVVLLMGSAQEHPLVQDITETLGNRALPVCGLKLDQLAALIAKTQLLVGNDSALAHLASALSVPVVVIWGYTDFHRASPVNQKGVLIRINYACNPCYDFAKGYIDDCPYHLKCIRDISVDQVQRIVVQYITSLRKQEPLAPEIFAGNSGVLSMARMASGCVRLDLRAA